MLSISWQNQSIQYLSPSLVRKTEEKKAEEVREKKD